MYRLSFYKKAVLWASRYPVPGVAKCRVLFDYLRLFKQKGITMGEYSDYEFDKCTEDFRQSFLGLNEQRYYLDYLNPKRYFSLARNKYLAHRVLDETGVRKSVLYCYYDPSAKYQGSSLNASDLSSVLGILRDKGVSSCVIKATESSHGAGVIVAKLIEYQRNDAVISLFNDTKVTLSSILKDAPLVFESVVQQSEFIASFNRSSVNTVRFMTTLYPDGEARIIATFMRVGREGRCVDNAGGGGNVDASIDFRTGKIDHVIKFEGIGNTVEIESHPDSGVQMRGVMIPGWDGLCSEVLRYQQSFPFCKAAGWDIAITDDGPVVIEVNDMWDQLGQMFIQKGWRKEIRDCFMAWKSTGKKVGVGRYENTLSLKHLKAIASHE